MFHRVTNNEPCPICTHDDWCMVSDDGCAVICPRTEMGSVKAIEAGYLHILRERPRLSRGGVIYIPDPIIDRTDEADEYREAAEQCGLFQPLAIQLGVSIESLMALGVGWCAADSCSTWPMWDHTGSEVVGITRRFEDGTKRLFKGHHPGLYMTGRCRTTMFIVEGGSDLAVAYDLGFAAMGRFSCSHSPLMVRRALQHIMAKHVVIVADTGNDHELRGAEKLGAELSPHFKNVLIMHPPMKDLREWVAAGATREDVIKAARAARKVSK